MHRPVHETRRPGTSTRPAGGRRRASALFCAFALAALTLLPGTALAATANTSTTLTAGDLSITRALTAGTFAGTLTGLPQSLAADASGRGSAFGGFQVRDARGSGVGWSVTVSAGRLVNAAGSGHAFALASLTMPLLAVAADNAGSSAVPGTLHGAAAVDNSADGSSGGVVMAATSAAGQGMGTYDFTAAGAAPWRLAVPANAYAGTYTSTVTTTLATLSSVESTSFASVSSMLSTLMLNYYAQNGRWARSWTPYCYTDLGLDPTAYASPIGNVYYKPAGSMLQVKPAAGYKMTVTGAGGQTFVLTSQVMWILAYDATSGLWYYHAIDPANLIDIATLAITSN